MEAQDSEDSHVEQANDSLQLSSNVLETPFSTGQGQRENLFGKRFFERCLYICVYIYINIYHIFIHIGLSLLSVSVSNPSSHFIHLGTFFRGASGNCDHVLLWRFTTRRSFFVDCRS